MLINGVKISNSKIFKSEKGNLYKYLDKKNITHSKFGETYFVEILKNKKKNWIKHKKNFCHLAAILGQVQIILVDERAKSKTIYKKNKFLLSKNNNKLLIIPPGVKFKISSKQKLSLMVNTINYPHRDSEVEKA